MTTDDDKTATESLSSIREQMQRDPIEAIKLCKATFSDPDAGYRKLLWATLVLIYTFAKKLMHDAALRDQFYGTLVSKKQPTAANRILKDVCVYVLGGATSRALHDRASTYAKAMYGDLQKDSTPEAVHKRLQEEGVERMYRNAVEEGKASRQPAGDEVDDAESTKSKVLSSTNRNQRIRTAEQRNSTLDQEDGPDAARHMPSAGASDGDDSNEPPRRKRMPAEIDESDILYVETKPDLLAQALAVPVGTKVRLIIRREPDDGGEWKRFVALHMKKI